MANVDISREGLGINEENSEERPTPEVIANPIVKKQSPMSKFIVTFLGGQPKDVAKSILIDVVIPATKDMFYDTFNEGLRRILYPGDPSANRRAVGNRRYDYGKHYVSSPNRDRPTDRGRTQAIVRYGEYDFSNIIFRTHKEAEDVLDKMSALIERYNLVSVSDLYSMCGVDHDYTSNNYGWYSIARASIQNTRDGFILDMPRPEKI